MFIFSNCSNPDVLNALHKISGLNINFFFFQCLFFCGDFIFFIFERHLIYSAVCFFYYYIFECEVFFFYYFINFFFSYLRANHSNYYYYYFILFFWYFFLTNCVISFFFFIIIPVFLIGGQTKTNSATFRNLKNQFSCFFKRVFVVLSIQLLIVVLFASC